MSQKLVQEQGLTQSQILAPQQLMLAGLLSLSLTELEQRVRNEMVDNIALEEPGGEAADDDAFADDMADAGGDAADGGDEMYERSSTESEMDNYLTSDDVPDYLLRRADAERERAEIVPGATISFRDRLMEQMGECVLTPHEEMLMEYLIGSLEDDGLLHKPLYVIADEIEVYRGVPTTEAELEGVLSTLQTFEPRGIGARSLQECLLLQVDRPGYRSDFKEVEIRLLERSYDDFIHKRWDVIRRRLKLSEEEFDTVKRELTRLNPRPGTAMSESMGAGATTVIPDFVVYMDDDGEPLITLNHGDVPELKISRAYRDTIAEYAGNRRNMSREQRETYTYAKQKVDAAGMFIGAIRQRRDTLMAVMRAIVKLQRAYFDDGDEMDLRPMALKDIAELTGLDISTVSRVTSNKYVETEYGVLPLKFFFSNVYGEGDNEVSTRTIKTLLREMIDAEDKTRPLTDDALTGMLNERGYGVARRTVAKYREQLNIPVARLRR